MENTTDENPLRELLDELISSLERLETRSEAIHQYLVGKGKVTEKALAPFMEQAANASEVRWRAFRVRAEALLAAGTRELETDLKSEQSKPKQSGAEDANKAEPRNEESVERQDDGKANQEKDQTRKNAK